MCFVCVCEYNIADIWFNFDSSISIDIVVVSALDFSIASFRWLAHIVWNFYKYHSYFVINWRWRTTSKETTSATTNFGGWRFFLCNLFLFVLEAWRIFMFEPQLYFKYITRAYKTREGPERRKVYEIIVMIRPILFVRYYLLLFRWWKESHACPLAFAIETNAKPNQRKKRNEKTPNWYISRWMYVYK